MPNLYSTNFEQMLRSATETDTEVSHYVFTIAWTTCKVVVIAYTG